MPLAPNLRDARLRLGMSQQAVADAAGTSRDTVASLESGRTTNPGIFTLYPIAEVLGLRIETLMDRQPLKERP